MKRSSRFLIAFAAAALTFGSLAAFVGPRHWRQQRHGHCHAYADRHWHQNDNRERGKKQDSVEKQQKPESDSSNY
jgi:hypothetical protein